MQRRTLSRRLLLLPSLSSNSKKPGSARSLVRYGHARPVSLARPQLPFLSTPLARNHQFRYLTTERKEWLKREVVLGVKYTAYFWAMLACCVVAWWSVQQEWLERHYPTPHEWGFITRLRFRLAKWSPDRTDWIETDWVIIGEYAKNVISRLEDRKIEGAGLEDLAEGGIWIEGVGECGFDTTAKSENWRRGYYEALMLGARAAEQLDDHVVDTTRRLVFPKSTVVGPSNPDPRPIPFGAEKAPLEENCERAYDEPDTFYLRILTTKGFSSRQKMDAALAYAAWLDFKTAAGADDDSPDAAARMLDWALSLASEPLLPDQLPYDPQTYVLQDGAPAPSTNILTALTALATHKARNNDISSAMPILLSILRARRALPEPQSKKAAAANLTSPNKSSSTTTGAGKSESKWTVENLINTAKWLVLPPAYPDAPDDGSSAPVRDARERCEEAALNLYIGEIIFASSNSSKGGKPKAAAAAQEDGLAWTREAVDLAEEQLHSPSLRRNPDPEARKTCKECLSTGLENWAAMAARLARDEREQFAASTPSSASTSGSGSWFSLWGSSTPTQQSQNTGETGGEGAVVMGRWAAEENVVKERTRRALEVLEELEVPNNPISSIYTA
ncbi:hypothetical protein F4777DRAFT_526067 [Nemania sp. FL0916]|nr:hypothetical protein F4777DRAFT_526067 [Nemania sp. FL0916]